MELWALPDGLWSINSCFCPRNAELERSHYTRDSVAWEKTDPLPLFLPYFCSIWAGISQKTRKLAAMATVHMFVLGAAVPLFL